MKRFVTATAVLLGGGGGGFLNKCDANIDQMFASELLWLKVSF